MKSLKVVLAILLVVCLVMGLAACEPATPPPAPSTSTSTSTPPPTTPVVTPTPTTSTPSKPAHNIDWQPGGSSTTSVDADKVGELTGTGTYKVNEVTAAATTVKNLDFAGTLVFGKITAAGKTVEINTPNATVVFTDTVTATKTTVTASLNTTKVEGNAKFTGELIINKGNLVVTAGTLDKVSIPSTNDTITSISISGGTISSLAPAKAVTVTIENAPTVTIAPTAKIIIEQKSATATVSLDLENASAAAIIKPSEGAAKVTLPTAPGTKLEVETPADKSLTDFIEPEGELTVDDLISNVTTTRVISVKTLADLKTANSNDAITKINVEGNIIINEALTLGKNLEVFKGNTLKVTAALTATDKTITNNGTLDLSAAITNGTINSAGDVILRDNGSATITAWSGNGSYAADDNATFVNALAAGNVKLLKNIAVAAETIAISSAKTIDLNGFSVDKRFVITGSANTTIKNGTIAIDPTLADPAIDSTSTGTLTVDKIVAGNLAKRAVRASAGTLKVLNSLFTMGNAANAPTAVQVLGTANLAEFFNNTITNATSSAPGWAGTGLLIWGKATADESYILGNKFVGCQLGIAYSDYNNIAEDKWLNSTASLPTAEEYTALLEENTFNMSDSWDKIRVSIEANSLANIQTINSIAAHEVTTIFLKANVEINKAIALAKRLVVTSDNTLTINNDMLTIAESSIGKIIANAGSTVYVPAELTGNVEGDGTITTIAPPSITSEIVVADNKFTVTIVKGTFDFESIEIDSHFLDAADQTITKESAAVELDFRIGGSTTSIADAITASNLAYANTISLSQVVADNGDLALTVEFLDYAAFVTAMTTKYTLTDFAPAKMHIYVVGKDAKGYTSGHMGSPELGEPTAKQADVTLVAPAPESVVA